MQLFDPEKRCVLLLSFNGVNKAIEGVHHVTFCEPTRILECIDSCGNRMVVGGRDFTFMITEMPDNE